MEKELGIVCKMKKYINKDRLIQILLKQEEKSKYRKGRGEQRKM